MSDEATDAKKAHEAMEKLRSEAFLRQRVAEKALKERQAAVDAKKAHEAMEKLRDEALVRQRMAEQASEGRHAGAEKQRAVKREKEKVTQAKAEAKPASVHEERKKLQEIIQILMQANQNYIGDMQEINGKQDAILLSSRMTPDKKGKFETARLRADKLTEFNKRLVGTKNPEQLKNLKNNFKQNITDWINLDKDVHGIFSSKGEVHKMLTEAETSLDLLLKPKVHPNKRS